MSAAKYANELEHARKSRELAAARGGFDQLDLEVAQRLIDAEVCFYCGSLLLSWQKRLDHVHPLFLGGSHEIDNLVVTCQGCNQHKGLATVTSFLSNYNLIEPFFAASSTYAKAAKIEMEARKTRTVNDAINEVADATGTFVYDFVVNDSSPHNYGIFTGRSAA
jgi:hypothetical protein